MNDEVAATNLVSETAEERTRRWQANFENLQRQTVKDIASAVQRAEADFALDILPVMDAFNKALFAAEHDKASSPVLLDGMKMTHAILVKALAGRGVAFSAAMGKPFDPHKHEAINQIETTQVDAGTVLMVYEDGYTIGERLLRAAKVAVAKKP